MANLIIDPFILGWHGKNWHVTTGLDIYPQVKYDYRNMAFTLKYQSETAVENRPQGNTLWFKFLYAF